MSPLLRSVPRSVDAAPATVPVRAHLTQRFRQLIMDGELKPGDHLIERELCELLDVSRPSLREALRQLEAEGLIDIIPNRGPMVRRIDHASFLELWEVRLTLEPLVARRFALHGTAEQIEALDKAIQCMDRALRLKNVAAIKKAKRSVSEAFAAGANNNVLAEYIHQINARLSFLWSSSLLFSGRPAESISELHALLGAIRARNPEAAHAAIVLHNENAKAIALHALDNIEQSSRAVPRKKGATAGKPAGASR
jgi:DNA-binding GntR family transcriptional regulator